MSRRSVVRTAAWTAPAVIAVHPAPASAATSPACQPVSARIDWATPSYARSSDRAASYLLPDPDGTGPGQGLTLTISYTAGSNTRSGNQAGNRNDNLRVSTAAVGGTGDRALMLHQSPIEDKAKTTRLEASNKSVTTFTFSRPVTNLRFTICDIDSADKEFVDAVGLDVAGFSASVADRTRVAGVGTLSDPLRAATTNGPVDDAIGAGNVGISVPAVTSFSLHWWNLSGFQSKTDGDQGIYLSDFTFDYAPC